MNDWLPEGYLARLTSRAREALGKAEHLARQSATALTPAVILAGLAKTSGSLASLMLRHYGLTEETLRGTSALKEADLSLAPFVKAGLKHAAAAAAKHGNRYIGTEHLLYGLISLGSTPYHGTAVKTATLNKLRAHLDEIFASFSVFPAADAIAAFPASKSLQELAQLLGAHHRKQNTPSHLEARSTAEPHDDDTKSALAHFGDDLVEQAKSGELDILIGREAEQERLIHILSRRCKNNPILIGEPGVGKTAIVYGLARRMAEGRVPEHLAFRKLIALDLGLVIAGTVFRGEFEGRLKEILLEAKHKRAILFIDEVHNVVGAGSAQGSLDAANILKPALARGDLQCIGATTLDEYRRYVEKDAALERRFQPVLVPEATPEATEQILEGLKPVYESHHAIVITPEALRETVRLAHRYLHERVLPDKALDVLDEAASRLRAREPLRPAESRLKALRFDRERLAGEFKQAIFSGEYERALTVQRKQRSLELSLGTLSAHPTALPTFPKPTLKPEHVRAAVAQMTGIPVHDMAKGEAAKLLALERVLARQVIGQPEAISAVARTLRRARAGLAGERRPWGSFLFLGPTGVGKTELARVLAETIFGKPEALFKVDMSEYAEPHSIARFIGAPPGYVGYEEGGALTETIRKNPFSLLLLDEVEKAHPQVHNILLQILEDGILTDSHGRRINFSQTIIILTSNIGTEEFTRAAALGFSSRERAPDSFQTIRERTLSTLKHAIRPELLSRIDHTIVFRPLDPKAILSIVRLHTAALKKRLAQRGCTLSIDRGVEELLARTSWKPSEGARLVRRVLEEKLENPLAQLLIRRGAEKSRVRVSPTSNRLVLR
ncbi:ATP-dependent Clp protease ATP-binding subunit [Candidatus Parcubacteria bacterium]|nr:ATP-dependent Clp protease ATP-binding subunit [Candidatus Parcubacteria bacterium]